MAVVVNLENTWMGMRLASRAMPEKLVPLPVAMPATCVPWAQPFTLEGQLAPEPAAVELATAPGQTDTDG